MALILENKNAWEKQEKLGLQWLKGPEMLN